jgi:FkbM family methyltransferase
LKPGGVIIDVGANIGLYSIIGSKRVGSTGKVFAFEPSKANFNLFLKNIELNQIKNIIPINKGLGDKIADKLILSQNPETGDGEKYILKDENLIKNEFNSLDSDQVNEIISLDTLDNFQLNNDITKVDFLKIDVEGYEYYVLKGAEKLLKNNPEIIILFECAEHLAKRVGSTQKAVFTLLNNLDIEIVYWDEKEKKWSTDLIKAMKSGQLLGGRNIMTTLNNLSLNKSNIKLKSKILL